MSADVQLRQLVDRIDKIERRESGPTMVALDGPSGAGKSTLAAEVVMIGGAVIVEGDDFYRGGTG